jgi:chromate transporter
MLASGLVLARSADHSLVAGAVTLISIVIFLRTRVHPLLLMGVGAALGLLGLI